MNKYPEWWNQTITVYNKYEDAQGKVSWYRTVIPNCFWKYTGEKLIVNGSLIETNVTVCRIPKDERFLERYLWEELGEEGFKDYFTLSIGDFIIKGEVTDNIDEYTPGLRSSDFISKYKRLQGCTIISRVAVNTEGGRVNEHYSVRGD